MKNSSRNSIFLLVICVVCANAPLWIPHFPMIAGHKLFGTPDFLVLLSVTLLCALLGSYILPDFMVANLFKKSWSRPISPLSAGLLIFTILGMLALTLFLVNQRILHAFLSSGDEHSCYFLAECLRKGKLYVELPALSDFFKVVHVGMRDGKWFSVYPLGWPLIWAFGISFRIADWLNPIMAAIAIFFFYLAGKKLYGSGITFFGLLLMFLSPFFIFTASSYFSHATCLLCIAVFIFAFLQWREAATQKKAILWAGIAGFACGYGLMTRYLTMAAIAGPFLLYHLSPNFLSFRGFKTLRVSKFQIPIPHIAIKKPQLKADHWLFFGILAAFIVSILIQNYLVTGKPLRAPVKHNQSWERLGFKKGHYTPMDGFLYVISRIFYLADWFPPALIAVYLFFLFTPKTSYLSLKDSKSDTETVNLKQLFSFSMVFLAFAYFLYYSWGGNQWGPRYWWEGMPFLCITVADWIVTRWKRGDLHVKKFLVVLVLVSIGTSGILFQKHAAFTAQASYQRRSLYDLAEKTIRNPAIVFIHGNLGNKLILAEEDAVRNSPFLDTKILYAHDLGDRNKELTAAYPARIGYRGSYDTTSNQPVLEVLG